MSNNIDATHPSINSGDFTGYFLTMRTFKNPLVDPCGHVFEATYIKQVFDAQGFAQCPISNIPFKAEDLTSAFSDAVINAVKHFDPISLPPGQRHNWRRNSRLVGIKVRNDDLIESIQSWKGNIRDKLINERNKLKEMREVKLTPLLVEAEFIQQKEKFAQQEERLNQLEEKVTQLDEPIDIFIEPYDQYLCNLHRLTSVLGIHSSVRDEENKRIDERIKRLDEQDKRRDEENKTLDANHKKINEMWKQYKTSTSTIAEIRQNTSEATLYFEQLQQHFVQNDDMIDSLSLLTPNPEEILQDTSYDNDAILHLEQLYGDSEVSQQHTGPDVLMVSASSLSVISPEGTHQDTIQGNEAILNHKECPQDYEILQQHAELNNETVSALSLPTARPEGIRQDIDTQLAAQQPEQNYEQPVQRIPQSEELEVVHEQIREHDQVVNASSFPPRTQGETSGNIDIESFEPTKSSNATDKTQRAFIQTGFWFFVVNSFNKSINLISLSLQYIKKIFTFFTRMALPYSD